MEPSGNDDTVAASEATLGTSATGAAMVTGELIGGRYRITRYLGGGGMGNVYAAVDTELGEPLAIKVLRRDLTDAAIDRFRTEVRLQRRITHKNVARIHDIGDHRGEKLLTMELVDGESLAARLERLGPVPLGEMRKIAADVLAGLGAAHAAGVIHLDLKPANVLLSRDGRAVIADFGIARASGDVGVLAGTPAYMAPEQHALVADLDARADLYAFGVMMFELATGRRPYAGTTLDEYEALKHAPPPDPRELSPGVPPAMVAVIQRCLAHDRAARPESAEAVALAVERALRDAGAPGSGLIAVPVGADAQVIATVAVLPITAAPADAYLADGLAEDVADALSRTATLRVLPATAVRGLTATGVAAGAALGVDHIVEGSLRRVAAPAPDAGDKLRLAVRLVSVRDGFQVWADRRDTVEAELLAVGEELATGLAAALSSASAARPEEIDPRAVDIYLRARHHLREAWNFPVAEAIVLLEEAAAAAPNAPTIVSTLATARVRHWMLTGSAEAAIAARAAADRAMVVGPHHGEARYARAQVRMNSGDLVGGLYDLGAAIRLAPLLPEVHYTAGLVLHEVGQSAEGDRRYMHCLELDPRLRSVVHTDMARIAELRGDRAESTRLLADLVAGDPPPATARLVGLFRARLALWHGEDHATALKYLVGAEQPTFLIDRLIAAIKHVASAGRVTDETWQAQMASADDPSRPLRGRLVSYQLMTEVAMVTGQRDLGFDGLERAGAAGLIDVSWLRGCPLIAPLADDSRYGAVLAQVASRAQQIADAYHAGLVGK